MQPLVASLSFGYSAPFGYAIYDNGIVCFYRLIAHSKWMKPSAKKTADDQAKKRGGRRAAGKRTRSSAKNGLAVTVALAREPITISHAANKKNRAAAIIGWPRLLLSASAPGAAAMRRACRAADQGTITAAAERRGQRGCAGAAGARRRRRPPQLSNPRTATRAPWQPAASCRRAPAGAARRQRLLQPTQ